MLGVPDHWGRAPLAEARGFQARLRAWADSGVEMFVHGWFHRDTAEHKGAASLKAAVIPVVLHYSTDDPLG